MRQHLNLRRQKRDSQSRRDEFSYGGRKASVVWQGDSADGCGLITTESSALSKAIILGRGFSEPKELMPAN